MNGTQYAELKRQRRSLEARIDAGERSPEIESQMRELNDQISEAVRTGALDVGAVYGAVLDDAIALQSEDFSRMLDHHLTIDFAAKKPKGGSKKNCTPGKSHFCKTEKGAGSCVSLKRKCRYQPSGAAKEGADYVAKSASSSKKTPKPKAVSTDSASDLETMRKQYNPKTSWSKQSNMLDHGNQLILDPDEIQSSAKPKRSLSRQFEDGKENFNLALVVVQDGGNSYRPVGDRDGVVTASAREAGARARAIVLPDDENEIAAARVLQQFPDRANPDGMREFRSGNSLSDAGNIVNVYADEMVRPGTGKRHDATPEQVREAAREILQRNTRNWVPVQLRQTGDDSYEVVGNHFAYDVMKEAGIDRMWAVIVEDAK